ncbi:MAG TPA: substrate-binding domain-containing protein [Pseudolysinimonas sp.]|jgi:D-xylose transport system substrate-binding protein|nr:substrate-binding domain-containing protein [Pseudolysinimonas sp.]
MRAGRLIGAAIAAVLAAASLTGCVAADSGAVKIALLLPDAKTARYETFDKPYFTNRINQLGDFDILYSNADQDASKQQSQAEAALASGVKVLVLDPVDGAASVSIVAAANAQGVPVIAYDRFISGGELAFYVSFDNANIGHLQASALVAKLDEEGAGGGILMVNGSPTDNNAGGFKSGAHSVIDTSGYPVLAEFDTPDWSPDKAQDWVASQITQFRGRISAIYAANDGTASGAIAAVYAANLTPRPFVTGQDAELAAIQRIVSGDQYMTIYKDIKQEAELAAEMAVRLARGEAATGETVIDGTPATLLGAEVVTVDTILDTVVADGVYTVDEICTAAYEAACERAGIR